MDATRIPGENQARRLHRSRGAVCGTTCHPRHAARHPRPSRRTRYEIQSAVRRRILDLAPAARAKLNGKLEDWHELDFSEFRAEIKRAFHVDMPVRERADWEAYLAENRAKVVALGSDIAAAEREIDAIVYGLFDLTPPEIALLEASLEGQY